jgi:VIT1/CCC1 family predicted Fe2+/Mn2+ transporter
MAGNPRSTLSLRHFLPDMVYGANDGLITTFAIVAGVTGAGLSMTVVLILGFSSLLADGFSMATSSYLAQRTPTGDESQTGTRHAARHALATFAGFVLPGIVPLLAYLLPVPVDLRFIIAAIMTFIMLFIIGVGRGLAAGLPALRAGLEMLLVGALAAGVAFGVGALGAMLVDGGLIG